MKEITVSINPSYFCNFRCNFCYLTPEQLGDQKRISMIDLNNRLQEITLKRNITWVDLYGGEIGALKKNVFYGMRIGSSVTSTSTSCGVSASDSGASSGYGGY